MHAQIVVVGNGMVGHKLVEELLARNPQARITIVGEEPDLAYDRVHLSSYFSGSSKAELSLVPTGYYEQHHVRVLRGTKACAIDCARRSITCSDGSTLSYDHLVLATGSYPFVPPLPGREQAHIHVYRTFADLDAIKASAGESKRGVVLGGGLLGLECANALKELGLETHVIEFAPQLMGVQLDAEGGELLKSKIEALGVRVHTGKNTKEIAKGTSSRYTLHFADGSQVDTDMLVFSVGIRPRDELARASGLSLGERGGIVIDEQCRTSDPHIYAVGECALWSGRIFGLVAPGYQMASVCADAIVGQGALRFQGADMSTKLKLLGVEVASIGDSHGKTPGAKAFRFRDDLQGVYKKLVISPCGKRLLGAILVGDATEYGILLQVALSGLPLPEQPGDLILPGKSAGGGIGVDALPESATICSCHNVTKGQLVQAVAQGATTLGAIKSCTKASTGCGGCATLTKQILQAELKRQGLEVTNHLCEHFAFSRQQLYDLVRVQGIRTFSALLARHGHGDGCEICKPAVASILASCWNEHILEETHAPLQDTNDRYLANMQKDGTYSIVPRVPGGEISPRQLIAIGQVAEKWRLYTKITGGQRIDLFGARLEQLPHIWEELIAHGFESGHAYGKALRTVKSCVGSTWCRYGQQDSVGLAIALEHRYKGLRSPHKLKFAVSGCTRECAEAQGKDVGVIATDKGWNLYVCGNGGMRPRHADLLATDIDTQTLLRTIDRFLMYYVKTADRLTRTSTWLEGLEGGLEHLKQVVLQDSLGICAQLEAEMQYVIDTYQCEWKTAVEDPNKRKMFRHFINADSPDANVIFVEERGQIRPASAEEKAGLMAASA